MNIAMHYFMAECVYAYAMMRSEAQKHFASQPNVRQICACNIECDVRVVDFLIERNWYDLYCQYQF